MKINLEFSPKEILYTEPIVVIGHTLEKNRLLNVQIIKVDNMAGDEIIGQIDLTNLHHFHQYSLEEWEYLLDNFFREEDISLDQIILSAPYFNMIKTFASPHAGELLAIIEDVLFVVIEKLSPVTLSFIENRQIKINGLHSFTNPTQNLPECLKIKIRPTVENLNEVKNLINDCLQKDPEILFRLDGNRTFELKELQFFMNELEVFCGEQLIKQVEYLEEPLKNQYDYLTFSKTHPYYDEALDESVSSMLQDIDSFRKLPAGTHIVLKPSLLGISKCLALMDLAFKTNHNAVISSSYETNSCMRPLLFMAANNPNTYHGLDTLKYLPKEYSIPVENFCLKF